jgi:DNA helicase IV
VRSLGVNYRTPEEVMAEAEPIIRAVLPDANVPTSIRRSGLPVLHGSRADLEAVVEGWLAAHDEGIACVIGDPSFAARPRVHSLAPELTKGLEFDLVVLVDPESFGNGTEGAVDRYVAMTRATRQLVVLTDGAKRGGRGQRGRRGGRPLAVVAVDVDPATGPPREPADLVQLPRGHPASTR